MSRKKVPWKKGDALANYWISRHGHGVSTDVIDTLMAWEHLFAMKLPGGKYCTEEMRYFGFDEKAVEDRFAALKNDLAGWMYGSVRESDGRFFRELADFIETRSQAVDKMREFLITTHFPLVPPRHQDKFFTRAEVQAMLERQGWDVSVRYIEKLFTQLGIKFKGKPGRPRGAKLRTK